MGGMEEADIKTQSGGISNQGKRALRKPCPSSSNSILLLWSGAAAGGRFHLMTMRIGALRRDDGEGIL